MPKKVGRPLGRTDRGRAAAYEAMDLLLSKDVPWAAALYGISPEKAETHASLKAAARTVIEAGIIRPRSAAVRPDQPVRRLAVDYINFKRRSANDLGEVELERSRTLYEWAKGVPGKPGNPGKRALDPERTNFLPFPCPAPWFPWGAFLPAVPMLPIAMRRRIGLDLIANASRGNFDHFHNSRLLLTDLARNCGDLQIFLMAAASGEMHEKL